MNTRLLTTDDVAAALDLSTAAGWNQTAEDWRRVIKLEPEGCFGIDLDGRLVATTTLITFGMDLAWVGMVLTHRDYQRRGLARALVGVALEVARQRQARSIKLDATEQGRPLYASLGFVDEQPVERWRRDAGPRMGRSAGSNGPIPWALDALAFGTDRSRFITALGTPSAALEAGYVMTREGRRARYVGPCVARDPDTARQLIGSVLDDGPWFWDVLPENQNARALAEHFGFSPVRHLVRMRLGSPLATRDDLVYGIAGFEAG